MKDKSKLIFNAFTQLRERIGKKRLNEVNKLCLAIINLPDETYYLLYNKTISKQFEITFENNQTITMTSRSLITKVKPKLVNEIFINVAKEDFIVLGTLDNSNSEQTISKKEYEIHLLDQKELDSFFQTFEYFNFEETYNFLFNLEFPDLIKDNLSVVEDNGVCITSHSGQVWKFPNSLIIDNTFYTNDWVRISDFINKMKIDLPTKERQHLIRNRDEMLDYLKHLEHVIKDTDLKHLPDYSVFQKQFYKLMELF